MLLTLIGIASDEPVPSHGGPAVSIVWTLNLNKVELAKYSTHERWVYDKQKRQDLTNPRRAPWELRDLEKRLKEALNL